MRELTPKDLSFLKQYILVSVVTKFSPWCYLKSSNRIDSNTIEKKDVWLYKAQIFKYGKLNALKKN